MVVVGLGIGAVSAINRPDTDIVVTQGVADSASAPIESTTTTEPAPTWPPSGVTYELTQPLPTGWKRYKDPGYPLLEGRQAITLSTVPETGTPRPTCDKPLTAIAALGPKDALISVVEVPGEYSEEPRPPATAWIPAADVRVQTCYEDTELAGLMVREQVAAFVEHGRTFRYTVALGADAGPDLEAEVVRVIDSLQIDR